MSKTTQRDHTERWLLALLVLVSIGFSLFIPYVFWSTANFQSIASQIPVAGVLTLAMAITMLTGGINLSIIATANASALVMAWMCTHLEPTFSSMVLMLLAGAAVALVVGLINGVLISVVRVSPILATLGIMTLLKGVNVLISKGSAISNSLIMCWRWIAAIFSGFRYHFICLLRWRWLFGLFWPRPRLAARYTCPVPMRKPLSSPELILAVH
ncbi:Monosaccharide-transporting ATPase [Yersinia aldovae ATCC 35236]|nr:Monosaccharide-transporting ATPase [Yersinia aldovae ATCC 35236]